MTAASGRVLASTTTPLMSQKDERGGCRKEWLCQQFGGLTWPGCRKKGSRKAILIWLYT